MRGSRREIQLQDERGGETGKRQRAAYQKESSSRWRRNKFVPGKNDMFRLDSIKMVCSIWVPYLGQ